MTIIENINLNGTLDVEDAEGNKKQAISINSNLTQNGNNLNFSFTITDKEAVTDNVADLQSQMDTFMTALKTKMTAMGYGITI